MHNLLPLYLQNWQLTPNANIHTHNTRRQHELHTFRTQHEFAKSCLRHNLPNTLNNTPALVIEKIIIHSLSGFANYTKHQYIQNYQTLCNIANCYKCRQNHNDETCTKHTHALNERTYSQLHKENTHFKGMHTCMTFHFPSICKISTCLANS